MINTTAPIQKNITLERMELRKKALYFMKNAYAQGGDREDQTSSNEYKMLTQREKDLVDIAFFSSLKTPELPKGYNGEDSIYDYEGAYDG